MDKRSQLKQKKEKEGNAPHLQRQRAAQIQVSQPQQPTIAPASWAQTIKQPQK